MANHTPQDSAWGDRILWLSLIVMLLLVTVPYLIAIAWAPAGKEFLGSFYNSQDTSVYLSAMRAGARGDWLRTLPFTSEPHEPAIYYPFYLLLGHLAPPTLLTFHIARLLCVVLMVFAAWWLIKTILSDQVERRTATVLSALGMGLGWVVLIAGLGPVIHPTDIFSPTATLINAAILNPHFPLGAALQFATLALYIQGQRIPYRKGTLLAGSIVCLVIGWVLPYQLFVVAVIIFAHIALQMWRIRKLFTPALRAGFFILAPSSSVVVYYAALSRIVPFWNDLIAQWPVYEHMFSPMDFAVGYGLLWVVALTGVMHLWRRTGRTDGEDLLIAWFVSNTAMLVSPLDFSDRTSLGFGVVLAILSAIALMRAIRRWPRIAPLKRRVGMRYPSFASAFPGLLLLIVIPSALLLAVSLPVLALVNGDLPFYLPLDDAGAINWLRQNAKPQDVVLASPPISNLIPAMTDARVYAGHSHETYQAARKLKEISAFFDAAQPEAERRSLLLQQHITIVYASLGTLDGEERDGMLTRLMRSGNVILYKFSGN